MVGKAIAIVNMKGGVGKTTLTVGLAEALAVMAKKRVLVIDLDAQASCTYALCGREKMRQIRNEHRHVYYLFEALLNSIGAPVPVPELPTLTATADPQLGPTTRQPQIQLQDLIFEGASSVTEPKKLDLLAAAPELQKLERDILFRLGQHEALQENPDRRIADYFAEHLAILRCRYDYVIIDCPPGISAFTAAAIRDADSVIAPGMPDYLSMLGLEVFATTVLRPLRRQHAQRRPARVILNRVRQIAAHDEYREEFRKLVNKMDDVLASFPIEVEQAPGLEAAAGGGDRAESIRNKYGQAIPTLERFAGAVIDSL
ncbi:MAG: ParA family protein [Caulobacterales bacterium]